MKTILFAITLALTSGTAAFAETANPAVPQVSTNSDVLNFDECIFSVVCQPCCELPADLDEYDEYDYYNDGPTRDS